jgi:hypothetical protein
MDFTRRVETDNEIRLTDRNGYVIIIIIDRVLPIINELIDYIDRILSSNLNKEIGNGQIVKD